MLFLLFRLIIWLTGLVVIGSFILGYFGYQLNWNYFEDRKNACQEELTQCRKDIVKGGLEGAKENCEFECVDPKLLIHKEGAK